MTMSWQGLGQVSITQWKYHINFICIAKKGITGLGIKRVALKSYPSFPGRVYRSAPPINVPLLLVLPRAHCLWQALGMLCWQESLLNGCASGVTAFTRTSIHSSSGVRIMLYSKLVEYLTSCSWPGPCPDTYQVGLPLLLVLHLGLTIKVSVSPNFVRYCTGLHALAACFVPTLRIVISS